ncbi:hypothetical protein [Mycobacteroides abscessus]|nr:hypothetical protein [Mycobacteroides abscessus]
MNLRSYGNFGNTLCRALVGVQLSQWADRNQLVVLAQSAKGGIG